MREQDIEKLKIAADLAYAKSLKQLAPVEARRRSLAAAKKSAIEQSLKVLIDDMSYDISDLTADEGARRAARRRAERLDGQLYAMEPELNAARRVVRKALAKVEVVSMLEEKLRDQRRSYADTE